ncbi:tRNA lysidine(34) synthetase TilS [Sinisalibacter lacisalsi]|uniref:tRNA(Ile)-lysidine synthase n=1 Tax=Sinisalibacter lacisalsi TaxID=1526570 RepID=A0ABQ1QWG9_9RHOB|nr:tRNA lysidine(34) synthetase TilS [Sinisalibacter lacisalsi]GGD45617.1 tRNA(Ile)-lysidine synthase [Sinisalibacter lacisalsi]
MRLSAADRHLQDQLCTAPHWPELRRLGIAVSGGGDSMALLHLLSACAREHGVPVLAATVDHGLRPEAGEEAAFVAETCAALGIGHESLRWDGWTGSGNLQAEARAARYRLLADWAGRNRLDRVALGHTMDDVAETFLMRLGREAGVDGLAAMEPVFERDGARFWRPALGLGREALRGFLTRHGLGWRDDPSNEDTGFDRVKARKVLSALAPLGIGAETLGNVAANLAAARRALGRCAGETAGHIARVDAAGDVVFDRAGFLAADPEIRRRLLARAIVWVSGADYPPRREALAGLEAAIGDGRTQTLHGCLVSSAGHDLRLGREYAAVRHTVAPTGARWDGRWRLTGPRGAAEDGLEIRALGAALKDCPGWRDAGLARAALMATPALWRGETLVAAPVAGLGAGISAEIDHPAGDFVTSFLSH